MLHIMISQKLKIIPDCPCYYIFKYKNAGISREPRLSANTDIVKIERRDSENSIILSSILYRFLTLSLP